MYRACAHSLNKSAEGAGGSGNFWSAEMASSWRKNCCPTRSRGQTERINYVAGEMCRMEAREGCPLLIQQHTLALPCVPCLPRYGFIPQQRRLKNEAQSGRRQAVRCANARTKKQREQEKSSGKPMVPWASKSKGQRRPAGESRCCRATTAKPTENIIANVFMTSNR